MAIGLAYGLSDPAILNLVNNQLLDVVTENLYYDNDNNLILDNNNNPYYTGQS